MNKFLAAIFVLGLLPASSAAQITDWWNESWSYRAGMVVYSGSYERKDLPVELEINFTAALEGRDFDENSIRVIEQRNRSTEIPSHFEKAIDYNSRSNAAGKLIWIMNTTPARAARYFYVYFDSAENPKPAPNYPADITIQGMKIENYAYRMYLGGGMGISDFYFKLGTNTNLKGYIGFSYSPDEGNKWFAHFPLKESVQTETKCGAIKCTFKAGGILGTYRWINRTLFWGTPEYAHPYNLSYRHTYELYSKLPFFKITDCFVARQEYNSTWMRHIYITDNPKFNSSIAKYGSTLQNSRNCFWDKWYFLYNTQNSDGIAYVDVDGRTSKPGIGPYYVFTQDVGYTKWDAVSLSIGSYEFKPGDELCESLYIYFTTSDDYRDIEALYNSLANPLAFFQEEVELKGNSSTGKYVFSMQENSIAIVDINPEVINLDSEGKWITAYIELPKHDVRDINVSTVELEGIKAEKFEIGDYDSDGILDLMVKFDRAKVQALLGVGEVKLTVKGKFKDGRKFEGSDIIKVIRGGKK